MRRFQVVVVLLIASGCGTDAADAADGSDRCQFIVGVGSVELDPITLALDFGLVAVGEAPEKTVELRSSAGCAPLPLEALATDFGPFSTDVRAGDVLEPDQSRPVTFRFEPGKEGSFAGEYSLPPLADEIRMVGDSFVPRVSCDSSVIDFGTIPYDAERGFNRSQTLALRCTNASPIARFLRTRWVEPSEDIIIEGRSLSGLMIPPDQEIAIPIVLRADAGPGPIRAVIAIELEGAAPVDVDVTACIAGPDGEGCEPPTTD